MANNSKRFFSKNNDQEKRAQQWFDTTDDTQPFDAFGSTAHKERIGSEIFTEIQREIRAKSMYGRLIRIAAAVLIFITAGLSASHFIGEHHAAENKIVWSNFHTQAGHMDKLVLSDSSIVYLRPGAILRVPQEFKGHLRQVELIEGEAFFEVRHDASHPFIVTSGSITTQVLGTSFLIKNYRQLKNIEVTVATGKVAVMHGKKLIRFLTPSQQLTFNNMTGETGFETASADLADNWKNGEYRLKNASIAELALLLENIYDVKIILKSARLQKLNITTQFNMKDNIQLVLNQLQLIHNVHYVINNKEVTLMK